MALDMLTTLIHSTSLITDSERDENKKLHTNLTKKLRKELADKNSPTIKLLRQLLPHAKPACSNTCEVIACEPVGSLMDTKVNFRLKKTFIANKKFNCNRAYE
jgi:mediator of RNA polymerase II transcription subunit 12